MNSSRSILAAGLWLIIALIIALPAVAAPRGKGGRGTPAAVNIDSVLLINVSRREIRAEIAGGGFNNGAAPVVSLDDGTLLDVVEVSATMIVANIPGKTKDGDYVLSVSTGADNNQNASTNISLGGTMSVVCVDWFRSGPKDEHIHTEIHVEDEFGNAVIGAVVTWTAENDVVGVYQTNTSATGDRDGHADGQGCEDPSGSGVTDWFCCIGAGDFDGDIPGKRACDEGFYTAVILDVQEPPFTNMIWDGITPENGDFLSPIEQ